MRFASGLLECEYMANSKDIPRSPCVFANVLDILGDRWTLLVIRDLLFFGKHEYKEFLSSPESIATNILSDRLKRLTAVGIIAEISHPTNKSRKLYYLTQKGKDLLPILGEIAMWGEKHLPCREEMKPLFERVKTLGPKEFKKRVLAAHEAWEAENLPLAVGTADGAL